MVLFAVAMQDTENSEKQHRDYSHLRQYQFKPGESGNPGGRPSNTMKDYLRRKFMSMSDEEKEQWLKENQVPGNELIRLAEGNPHSTTDTTIEVSQPIPLLGGLTQRVIDTVPATDTLPATTSTQNASEVKQGYGLE